MNHRQKEPHSKADPAFAPESLAGLPAAGARWLDSIDPGAHRRIKGLRLVTAFGIAAMLGTRAEIVRGLPAACHGCAARHLGGSGVGDGDLCDGPPRALAVRSHSL